MKSLLALLLLPFFATALRAETHLDYWSWSTAKDGATVGESLDWTIPDDVHGSLPVGDPLSSTESFMSETVRKTAQEYERERAAVKGAANPGLGTASEYKLIAFGYREVPRRSDRPDAAEHTGKWLRYLEYGTGYASLPIKIYLLPDGTILRPKIEPITNQQ